MSIHQYIAAQLRKPNGFIGRVLIARMLNWSNTEMNKVTLSALDLKDADHILEVGFGGGALLTAMAKYNAEVTLHGADFSPDMVKLCKKKMSKLISEGRLHLDCASVENLPYQAETFSKICSVNSIYFWEDCAAVIRELKRVLQQNGMLIITLGDKTLMSKQTVTEHGFKLYTALDVQQIMEAEGFSDIQIKHKQNSSGQFFSLIGMN